MNNIDDLVYAILMDGAIVIGTLECPEDTENPQVKFNSGTVEPAAMVFPAIEECYNALKILYGDMPVPKLPLTPNQVVQGLLERQMYVIARYSNSSYADARLNGKLYVVLRGENTPPVAANAKIFRVPYNKHGNEIKTV